MRPEIFGEALAETNILGETGYNNISDKTPYAISVLPYPTINALEINVVLRTAPDSTVSTFICKVEINNKASILSVTMRNISVAGYIIHILNGFS